MRRKKLIVPAIVTFIVAFTAFMIYFIAIHRAESLLEQLVKSQSNGELLFNVEKVKLDIIHLRFEFREPELRTKDTSTTVTGYHIKAENISFRAKYFIPFLLGRRILVDSVLILNPEIDVFKYKEGIKKKISLPEEMSKVYQSLEIVLNVLNLNYLHINSARFKIVDFVNPDNNPVEVSRLNLTVNKVTADQKPSDNRFLFADRILLEVFNQDILFLDGFHGLKFKRFSLNTGNQTVKLDSCYIYGKQADLSYGEFSSFVDTVRISKLDLNLLVNEDILKMDSALCINPDVTFLIPLKEKQKNRDALKNDLLKKDSLDFILKKMLGNLDIGYLTIQNAKVKIVTKKGDQSRVYNTSNSNFSIENVLVKSDPDVPIKVGRFNLDVRNYAGFSPDSLYVVRFDNIQIQNRTISLLNLRIGPTEANQERLSREVTMEAFEFNNINWAMLLYESRIVAGNVIMVKPELNFKIPGTKRGDTAGTNSNKNPFSVMEEFRAKVQIDDILIKDGSISIEDFKGTNFSINHINASLNANQILQSENAFRVVDALDNLSFTDGKFQNPKVQLLIKEGSFSKENNSLRFSQIIRENADQSFQAKMENVSLKGIKFNAADNISIDKFTWAKADLTMSTSKSEKDKDGSAKVILDYKFTIGHLSGETTMLNFRGNNFEMSTLVNQITTDKIVIEGDQQPKINGLTIDGQSFTFNQSQVKSNISSFNIQNQKISTLSNVMIRLPANKEIINVFIPTLIFSADIYENTNGIITADFIELQKPVISFETRPVGLELQTREAGRGGIPPVNIRRLTINQPELTHLPANFPTNLKLDPGKSNWNLLGLRSDGEMAEAESIRISLIKPAFENDKLRSVSTGKESVAVFGSDFRFNPGNQQNKSSWSFNLDTLKSSGLQVNSLQDDTVKQEITIKSLDFGNLKLNNENVSDLMKLVQSNDSFRISNANIAFANNTTRIQSYNVTFDKYSNSLAIDSITYSPLEDKEAFLQGRQYRSNYMRLNTGLIKAEDIDFDLLINDTSINAKKLTINDLKFYSYLDKRLPFQSGIEKPLLTDLLKRIKTKILLDSLLLKNALIEYEEFNDKTQQYGNLKLSKIRGLIAGIRNYDFSPEDSIKFNIYARFMDATDLRTSYSQSYTDSLSGFHLKVIASSMDLRKLNPMLKPMASAIVKRGYLDTLRMSVIGRKYVAYGIMKMYYHDLNVQYLNKGKKEKTLKSRLFTFFANRMVDKKNLNGSGDVYAERDPEKGFVNYWVKILIGGVLTNTGVRTDISQEKRYDQSIKKYNVPPIDDIPVNY